MNYIIIGAVIIALLVIYTIVATKNNVKKAPEKLEKAKKLFANGDSNAALRELGGAFALPFGSKITPEYNKHLLGVLDLLKQILDGMNVSSDHMIPKIYKRLSEGSTKTIELQDDLSKPIEDFFENTESDEKLVAYLQKAAMGGNVTVNSDYDPNAPVTSERTMEFVNRAGKLLMKGQPQQAAEVYNEALTQTWEKHDEAFLYDQLGSCHLMNKDLAAAEANYQKSISIDAYFTNVWNYCDFLVYNKRKSDAEAHLPQLAQLIRTKSDQKEYDRLFKKWQDL